MFGAFVTGGICVVLACMLMVLELVDLVVDYLTLFGCFVCYLLGVACGCLYTLFVAFDFVWFRCCWCFVGLLFASLCYYLVFGVSCCVLVCELGL